MSKKKKVLIVEDEMLVAYLMESYVNDRGCGCVVGTADNFDDAVSLVESEMPDVILMDVRICGDRDGIETAEEIDRRWGIPVIYCSGNSDAKTTERAKKTNMLGFLVKPVSREELNRLLCLL